MDHSIECQCCKVPNAAGSRFCRSCGDQLDIQETLQVSPEEAQSLMSQLSSSMTPNVASPPVSREVIRIRIDSSPELGKVRELLRRLDAQTDRARNERRARGRAVVACFIAVALALVATGIGVFRFVPAAAPAGAVSNSQAPQPTLEGARRKMQSGSCLDAVRDLKSLLPTTADRGLVNLLMARCYVMLDDNSTAKSHYGAAARAYQATGEFGKAAVCTNESAEIR